MALCYGPRSPNSEKKFSGNGDSINRRHRVDKDEDTWESDQKLRKQE